MNAATVASGQERGARMSQHPAGATAEDDSTAGRARGHLPYRLAYLKEPMFWQSRGAAHVATPMFPLAPPISAQHYSAFIAAVRLPGTKFSTMGSKNNRLLRLFFASGARESSYVITLPRRRWLFR